MRKLQPQVQRGTAALFDNMSCSSLGITGEVCDWQPAAKLTSLPLQSL